MKITHNILENYGINNGQIDIIVEGYFAELDKRDYEILYRIHQKIIRNLDLNDDEVTVKNAILSLNILDVSVTNNNNIVVTDDLISNLHIELVKIAQLQNFLNGRNFYMVLESLGVLNALSKEEISLIDTEMFEMEYHKGKEKNE